jgi:hypothetical protein
MSYWRWRDWIIAMGTEDTIQRRDMDRKWELMWNMSVVDLPDGFSQRPTPLCEVIGESLIFRANRLFNEDLVNEDRETHNESSEDEEGEDNSGDDSNERISLNINSPTK